MMNRSSTSLIEDFEEEDAKKLIEESLGFPSMEGFSKKLVVKIYTRPEEISTIKTEDGKTISLYLPSIVYASDKYRNCVALVINVAKDCYTDEEFKESGPYCKVGDWIIMPRNAGTQVNYRGVPVQIIPEKCPWAVIACPTHIERIT